MTDMAHLLRFLWFLHEPSSLPFGSAWKGLQTSRGKNKQTCMCTHTHTHTRLTQSSQSIIQPFPPFFPLLARIRTHLMYSAWSWKWSQKGFLCSDNSTNLSPFSLSNSLSDLICSEQRSNYVNRKDRALLKRNKRQKDAIPRCARGSESSDLGLFRQVQRGHRACTVGCCLGLNKPAVKRMKDQSKLWFSWIFPHDLAHAR